MQSVLDEVVYVVDNGLPPPVENEEDMGIRKEDWPSIHAELDRRIEEFRPKGFRKFLNWAQEIGIIGCYISIIIAMLAVTCGALYFSFNRVSAEGKFQGDTTRHLDDIDKHLQTIDNSFVNFRFNALSSEPITRESSAAIEGIILTASSQNVPLDHSTVTTVGGRLIAAADHVSTAWSATTVLLGYTSIQNKNWLPADAQQIRTPSFGTYYSHPAGWDGQLKWAGMGESPNVSELHQIGLADANEKQTTGPSYLIMEGGTVRLDGMIMKRIVIRNARVIYQGGPASLQSVFFVNCKFEIQPKPTGQMLATAIISDPSVNFSGE